MHQLDIPTNLQELDRREGDGIVVSLLWRKLGNVVTERAVEKHVTSIFTKLHLPPTEDDHRRVLAVLTYLRSS